MANKISQEKSEKSGICPGCQGFLLGAEIKRNLKDLRDCQGCSTYNKDISTK